VGTTFILCTNFLGELTEKSPATLSRFPIQRQFEWYANEELQRIITQYAKDQSRPMNDAVAQKLAQLSNGMPRRAVNMFKKAIDFASIDGSESITLKHIQDMMDTLGIDQNGLDKPMRDYLEALGSSPHGRMSLQALEGVLGVDRSTLTYVIEPILMKNQLISRCSAGREITNAGRAALSKETDRFSARRI
jgi:Holliday junction resolvasome RuvABC ATP-dependent DNA helicase subunit